MSKYSIEYSTLAAIGDAVREKGKTEDKILVSELAEAILTMPAEVLPPCEEVGF